MLTVKTKRITANLLLWVMLMNPAFVAANGVITASEAEPEFSIPQQNVSTGVVVDTSSGDPQRTSLKESANGTTVIDIAEVSQAGVSHNLFSQFNVDENGLILNNSLNPIISQLGGWTDGNRRLAGGTARIILAEVTGNSASSLLGFTEILGDSAEFVLANPNGITCNGCGFINTPRVTFATGTPDVQSGDLLGFNVTSGSVVIDGAGLNASNISKFDILTRAMYVNAALYANELNVYTGNNYIGYSAGDVQTLQNQPGDTPFRFALDASALGSMYVNSIKLIGTEAGLGVRSEGLISATESVELTADGRIRLKDTLTAGQLALRSESGDVLLDGTTFGESVNVEAGGSVGNAGTLSAETQINLQVQAQIENQGTILTDGNITLAGAVLDNQAEAAIQANQLSAQVDDIVNTGTLVGQSLVLQGTQLTNAGHIQGDDITIEANIHQIDGTLYQASAEGSLTITNAQTQIEGGLLAHEGSANVAATEVINSSNWLANGALNIDAQSVVNTGTLQAENDFTVSAQSLQNSGNVLLNSDMGSTFTISESFNNDDGVLQSAAELNIETQDISNQNGQILLLEEDGTSSLTAINTLDNANGQILSNGQIQLGANTFNNADGVVNASQVSINTEALSNQAGQITAKQLDINAQTLNNQGGTLAAERLSLSGSELNNQSGVIVAQRFGETPDEGDAEAPAEEAQDAVSLNLDFTAQINNSDGGVIESQSQDFAFVTEHLNNHGGRIALIGTGVLSVEALTLLNEAGTIIANHTALDVHTINNDFGSVLAQTQLDIQGTDISNQSGVIQAGEQLNIDLAGALTASGESIISAQNINLDTQQLFLGETGLINAEALTINTQNIENQGLIRAFGESQHALSLSAESLINTGRIESSGESFILENMHIDNAQGEIVHLGLGVLQLAFLGDFNNQNGVVFSQSDVSVSGLENGALLNTNGQVIASTNLELNTGSIENQAGVIQAQNQLTIHTGQLNNGLEGQISAEGAVLSVTHWNNDGVFVVNNANVAASRIENTGTIQVVGIADETGQNSGANTVFTLDTRELINQGLLLTDAANWTISNVRLNNQSGTIAHQGQGVLQIDAVGTLNNNQGVINANSLVLNAGSLSNNAGQIVAISPQANMRLNVQNSITNTTGLIGSAGGLNLSAGRLNNTNGTIQISGNGVINASTLDNLGEGQIFASNTLNLRTGTLNNQGTLQANQLTASASSVNNQGTIVATGTQGNSLSFDTRSLTNSGIIISQGENLFLNNMALNNAGGVIVHEGLGVLSLETLGSLNNEGGQIAGSGSLVLRTQNLLNDQGVVVSAGNAQLNFTDLSNVGGTLNIQGAATFDVDNLNNNGGQIVASTLDITTQNVQNNEGAIVTTGSGAGTGLTLNISGDLDNTQGQIASAGEQLNIAAANILNQQGLIQSDNALSLTAEQLVNAGLIEGGNVDVTVTHLDNQGDLTANSHLNLSQTTLTNAGNISAQSANLIAQTVDNTGTVNVTGTDPGSFTFNVQSLNNAGSIATQSADFTLEDVLLDNTGGQLLHYGVGVFSLAVLNELNNQNGVILSQGELHLTTPILHNQDGQILVVTGENTSAGSGVLKLDIDNITHTGTGVIASSGTLVMNTNNLLSDALISAEGMATINADSVALQSNSQLLTGDLSLQSTTLTNAGVLSAENTQIHATTVTNTGQIAIAGDVQLIATDFVNTQGSVQVTNNIDVDVASLNNTEGQILSNGIATLNATELLNQQGQIGAQQLTLNIANIDNTNAGQLFGEQTLTINTASLISNGEVSGAQLVLQAQNLTQQESAVLSANQLTLDANTVENAGAINTIEGVITLDNFNNTGTLQAQNSLALRSDALTNHGTIVSEGTLGISANTGALSLENAGTIGAGQLNIDVEQLNNQAGAVLGAYGESGNTLTLNVAQTLSNAGRIYNGGEAGSIEANIITNNGQIEHTGTGVLTLDAQRIENLSQGAMGTNGELIVHAEEMHNLGTLAGNTLSINAANTQNQGSMLSDALSITATELNNTGNIEALTAQITAQTLHNSGQILGAETQSGTDALSITAAQLNNTGALISRGENFTLSGISINNQSGQILHFGTGVFDIDTLSALNNQSGLLYSDGAFTLSTVALDNTQGRVLTQSLDIQANEIINHSGVLQAQQTLAIQANTLQNEAGLITLDSPQVEANNTTENATSTTTASTSTSTATTAVPPTRTAELNITQGLNNLNGVIRLEGEGQLTLNANDIQNTLGQILSESGLEIQAQTLLNTGEIGAQTLALNGGQLNNQGAIDATTLTTQLDVLNNSGDLAANTAHIQATQINNAGLLVATSTVGQSLTVSANNLTNTGVLASYGEDFTLSNLALNNADGSIVHFGAGVLSLEALSTLNNAAGLIRGATNLSITQSDIQNHAGLIEAANTLTIDTNSVVNQGGELRANTLDLNASQLNNQGGLIAVAEQLDIDVQQTLNNTSGRILSTATQANIAAQDLINDSGLISQLNEHALTVSVGGSLSGVDGVIRADEQLNVNVAQLNNEGTLASNVLNISVVHLNNQATIQANRLNIDAQSLQNRGLLLAAGTQGESLSLAVDGTLFNAGRIQSLGENLVLAGLVDNTNGEIIHAGVGVLQLDELINANGLVHTENQLTLLGSQINNNAGVLQANQSILLGGNALLNQGGTIQASDITINSAEVNNNAGVISAANNLSANVNHYQSEAGALLANNQLSLQANQVTNTHGALISASQTHITTPLLQNLGGKIESTQSMVLDLGSAQNQGGLILSAGDDFTLNLAQTFDNSAAGQLEVHSQDWLIDNQNINNQGGVLRHMGTGVLDIQHVGTLNNTQGYIGTLGSLNLQASGLTNSQGRLISGTGANINLAQTLNNDAGVIYNEAGNVSIQAATLNNGVMNGDAGSIVQNGVGTLTITAGDVNNQGLLQGQALNLSGDSIHNAGSIVGEQVSVNASLFNNNAGFIAATATDHESLRLLTTLAVSNQNGVIQSAGTALNLSQGLNNQGGELIFLGNGALTVNDLINDNGRVVSQGNIHSTGTLSNQSGTLQAANDIQLQQSSIQNQAGQIHAANNVQLEATTLNNQGGLISASGNTFALDVAGTLNNSAGGVLVTQANTMQISAGGLNNTGGTIKHLGNGQLSLNGLSTLNNDNGVIDTAGNVTLTLNQLSNNSGVIAANQATINAGSISNQSGALQASQLNINASNLNNTGGLLLGRGTGSESLNLTVSGVLNNTNGTLESRGQRLTLAGNVGAVNNAGGQIRHHGSGVLRIAQNSSLNNSAGLIYGAGSLDINSGDLSNNSGTIFGANGASVNTGALSNQQGQIQSNGALSLSSSSVNNSSGQIAANQLLMNSSGTIVNNGGVLTGSSVTLSGSSLNNSNGQLIATSTGSNTLSLSGLSSVNNNSGTISSRANNWNLSLSNLSNTGGQLIHQGTGTFTVSQSGTLANDGLIASGGNLTLNAGEVDNQGNLQAANALRIDAGLNNHSGAVLLAQNIDVNASGKIVSNLGQIIANNAGVGVISIDALDMINNGTLFSADTLTVNASNINNAGSISTETLTANGFNTLSNSGRIESLTANYTGNTFENLSGGQLVGASAGNVALSLNVGQLTNQGQIFNNGVNMAFGGSISNSGTITHAGIGVLTLGDNGSVDVGGGNIATAGTARLMGSVSGAGGIFAQTGMEITSATPFVNSNSQLYTQGNLQINAEVNNQGGTLIADGTLGINTSGTITNSSGVIQGQNLNLQAGTLANDNGTITSTGSGAAIIQAGSINNAGGLIQSSGSSLNVSSTQSAINNAGGEIVYRGSGVLAVDAATMLDNSSGRIVTSGSLDVDAGQALNNQNGVISGSHFAINAGSLNNQGGTISGYGSGNSQLAVTGALNNTAGSLVAAGTNFTINAAGLNNHNGRITHAGTGVLALTASSVSNTGASANIGSNGSINLNAGSGLANQGNIVASHQLTVNAGSLNNSNTLGSVNNRVDINLSGNLENTGVIVGKTGLDVNAQTIRNVNGNLESQGTINLVGASLNVGTIKGQHVNATLGNGLTVNAGETITASGNVDINTSGGVTNRGSLIASGTLGVSGTSLNNIGSIRSAGNNTLNFSGNLSNSGTLSSASTLIVNGGTLSNSGTVAGTNLDINTHVNNTNLVYAASNLNINGSVTNNNSIFSSGNAIISGNSITNNAGNITAAGNLTLSGTITNNRSGSVSFDSNGQVTTEVEYTDGNDEFWRPIPFVGPEGSTWRRTKEVRKSTTFSANATGSDGVIAAGRNLSLSGSITNNFSTISAGGNISVSGHLTNNAIQNRVETDITQVQETYFWDCMQHNTRACTEPGEITITENEQGASHETTFTGGAYGTIAAGGSISGNISGLDSNDANPLRASGRTAGTSASGSAGSTSVSSNNSGGSSANVNVATTSGNALSTTGQNRNVNASGSQSSTTVNGPSMGTVSAGTNNGANTSNATVANQESVVAQTGESFDQSGVSQQQSTNNSSVTVNGTTVSQSNTQVLVAGDLSDTQVEKIIGTVPTEPGPVDSSTTPKTDTAGTDSRVAIITDNPLIDVETNGAQVIIEQVGGDLSLIDPNALPENGAQAGTGNKVIGDVVLVPVEPAPTPQNPTNTGPVNIDDSGKTIIDGETVLVANNATVITAVGTTVSGVNLPIDDTTFGIPGPSVDLAQNGSVDGMNGGLNANGVTREDGVIVFDGSNPSPGLGFEAETRDEFLQEPDTNPLNDAEFIAEVDRNAEQTLNDLEDRQNAINNEYASTSTTGGVTEEGAAGNNSPPEPFTLAQVGLTQGDVEVAQNIFMSEEQVATLSGLGFNEDYIRFGEFILLGAVSQNNLLEDGVTIGAGNTVDLTSTGDINIDAGISGQNGVTLVTDQSLNFIDTTFIESDTLIGLGSGNSFTNTLDLNSEDVWLDIGGDFTNNGSITGSNSVDIIAGGSVTNNTDIQAGNFLWMDALGGDLNNNGSLLSGGLLDLSANNNLVNHGGASIEGFDVSLEAGGDIISRTEQNRYSETGTTRRGDFSFEGAWGGQSASIISHNSLSLNAGNDIDVTGSELAAAGDISLFAGNDVNLGAIEYTWNREQEFKGGYDKFYDTEWDVTSLNAGGNLSVVAGNDLNSQGTQFIAGGDASLAAGNEMNLLGVKNVESVKTKRTKRGFASKTVYIDEVTKVTHQGASIIAGGNVNLNAHQSQSGVRLFNSGDILMEGTQVAAGGDFFAYTQGELNVVSGEEWEHEFHYKKKSYVGGLFGSEKTTDEDVQYLGHAELHAGGNVTLLAQNDINVLAGNISGQNIDARAGFGNEEAKEADLNILGAEQTRSLYQESRKHGLSLDFSDNFLSIAKATAKENTQVTVDYIGSTFTAEDNVNLVASRDVNIVGSDINAVENIRVNAGRNANIVAGEGSQSGASHEEETRIGLGFSGDSNGASVFAGAETRELDQLTSNTQLVSSNLTAGSDISIIAGENINQVASNLVAVGNISFNAGSDINILSGVEFSELQQEERLTRTGLTVGVQHGVGDAVDALGNVGQGGDVISNISGVMRAVDQVNGVLSGPSTSAFLGTETSSTEYNAQSETNVGSTVTAGGNVTFVADGNVNVVGSDVHTGEDLTISATDINIIAATDTHNSQTNSDTFRAGIGASVNLRNQSGQVGVEVSGSESETDTQSTVSVGSGISAGGDITLNASDDILVVGSDINAEEDIALIAGDSVTLTSGESTNNSQSESSHFGAGVGVGVSANPTGEFGGNGIYANVNAGGSDLDSTSTTQTNAHVNAGGNLTVITGGDANIEGAVVNADSANLNIGGDLTIVSTTNTGETSGEQWSAGVSVSTGGGSVSVGSGQTTGTTNWVDEQTGINTAGNLDIYVGGHTQLDGAYINSESGDLDLDTGTFDFSDIEGHNQYENYFVTVGAGFSGENDANSSQTNANTGVPEQSSGFNSSISGQYSSVDQEQINRATVGQGTITVRDNPEQDLDDLNRDIDLAQETTKDESTDIDIYGSTTAAEGIADFIENPSETSEHYLHLASTYGEDVAEGVLTVTRNIEALTYEAPEEIQSVLPELNEFIKDQIIQGVETEELIEFLEKEETRDHIAALAPIAKIAEENPELLKEQLKAAVSFETNENGEMVITITGTGELPLATKLLDGLNTIKEAAEQATSGIGGELLEMAQRVLGGASQAVVGVIFEQLAQTETGQEIIEQATQHSETLSEMIGATGADLSHEEFQEELQEDSIYGGGDFNQDMLGGGEAVLILAGIILETTTGIQIPHKRGGNSSGGSTEAPTGTGANTTPDTGTGTANTGTETSTDSGSSTNTGTNTSTNDGAETSTGGTGSSSSDGEATEHQNSEQSTHDSNPSSPDNIDPDEAVDLVRGQKGDWNKVANNPEPKTRYEFENGYSYETDASGRVNSVEADLKLDPWDRNTYRQRKSGGECRESSDCGGHLIASMFGGPGESVNLVPMNAKLNGSGGKWYQLETRWKGVLEGGGKVKVKINPVYSGTSKRPTEFEVIYSIDNVPQRPEVIKNTPTGN